LRQLIRIISGGQSGVDRAALDFAIARRIPYGGWCPKDGWAEDMIQPPGLLAHYPLLRETPDRDSRQRTRWNVRDSDATLIFLPHNGLTSSPGTAFTIACVEELSRPVVIVDPGQVNAAARIREWLTSHTHPLALNIAGPRETQAAGIYSAVRAVLDAI
jgi:Circularly permutated YpsA SLOG family